MQFLQLIKKHYEKGILSVVLLGLVVAAGLLPIEVSRVRQFLDDTVSGVVRTKPKPFEPVDLTTNQVVLKRISGNVDYNYSELHNIFNPVRWQKRPDGTLLKLQTGKEIGPGALVVKSIQPLQLMVSFEGVSGSPDNLRYHFVVIRETETNPRKTQVASLGVPNTQFVLQEVKGPTESPSELTLVLTDSEDKDPITISKDKPYQRVIGYAAELEYPPAKGRLSSRPYRVKDTVRLPQDSDTYKIVAITQDEVVLSAESTQKRTTIQWHGAPQASSNATSSVQ